MPHFPPLISVARIDAFANDERCHVMLLSMGVGAEGLNIQCANHILFCEPHWNPQKECQAEHRLYRIGQTRDVTVHRYVLILLEKCDMLRPRIDKHYSFRGGGLFQIIF